MKLGYTILYVSNVGETLNFYQNAFGLEIKFFPESGDYGELKTGETTLSFVSYELAESNNVGFFKNKAARPCNEMEIGLVTNDVEGAFKKAVSAGAIEVMKPALKPWGQVISYVRDINGFLVEICSPVGE